MRIATTKHHSTRHQIWKDQIRSGGTTPDHNRLVQTRTDDTRPTTVQGPDQARPGQTRTDQDQWLWKTRPHYTTNRLDKAWPDQTKPELPQLHRTELDSTRFGRTRSDQATLHQTFQIVQTISYLRMDHARLGPDYARPGQTRLAKTGLTG